MSKPSPARKDNPLAIVYGPIDTLKPDPANPRQHSKKRIRQIANSIETFGFNVPVLIDADDKIIAGQGRVMACRELGWNEAPTISLDHLTFRKPRRDRRSANWVICGRSARIECCAATCSTSRSHAP